LSLKLAADAHFDRWTRSRPMRGNPVRLCLWLISATAAFPLDLWAQTSRPDGSRLRLGVDSLFVYTIRGRDTTATGRVRDELSIVRDGAEERLLRVYASTDAILGARLDTIIDRRGDLAPRYHHSQTESGAELVQYTAQTAVGYARLASGDSVAIRVALPAQVINGSSFDLFLRASDLHAGQQLSVTGFAASGRSLVPLEAKVTGEDLISGERCWRAEVVFGGMAVHFWVGRNSRRLHQQVMFIRPDLQILFRSTPQARRGKSQRAT
jgi:hypothetical protein